MKKQNLYREISHYLRHLRADADVFTPNGDAITDLVSPFCLVQPYGKVKEDDFPNIWPMVQALFAIDNKQYFIYKAVDDPTKIGYLSRKLYVEYCAYIQRKDFSGARVFLQKFGTMASPVKLLKRAGELSPYGRFLKNALEETKDGQTSPYLLALSRIISSVSNLKLEKCTGQEAYDLPIERRRGSGSRFATCSCMYGHKVGKFYDLFGAQAYKVVDGDKPIGRFLTWKMSNGKTYVDRLYIPGDRAQEALSLIDKTFPDAEKYGEDNPSGHIVFDENKSKELTKTMDIPYIDSFPYVGRSKDGEIILTQRYEDCSAYFVAHEVRRSRNKYLTHCKFCNKALLPAEDKQHTVTCIKRFKGKKLDKTLINEMLETYTKGERQYDEIFKKYPDSEATF